MPRAAELPDAAAVPITDLDHERLAQARRLFVVASTYGEGEYNCLWRNLIKLHLYIY